MQYTVFRWLRWVDIAGDGVFPDFKFGYDGLSHLYGVPGYKQSEIYIRRGLYFSAGYNIWSALLLPDILLAYFLFHKRQPHKYWSWFYIFLFAQTALIENCKSQHRYRFVLFYKHIGMFNYPALNISVLCLSVLFVYHVCKGRILSAAAFLPELPYLWVFIFR